MQRLLGIVSYHMKSTRKFLDNANVRQLACRQAARYRALSLWWKFLRYDTCLDIYCKLHIDVIVISYIINLSSVYPRVHYNP